MATENIATLALELGRATTEMRNFLRQHIYAKIKEHEHDITFELLEVLVLLYRKDGVNQQEIADEMIKDKSSMTYLINSLVKRRMVKRIQDKNDRRNKLIFVTDEGKSLQKKLNPWVIEMYEKATAGVKSPEIEKAILLVQKMIKNLKQNKL